MTRTGRFLILDPEERRRLHYKYFPGLNLTLALDEAPYRAEFGVGMLKGGHVQTSADSHAVEVRRMTDQPRISFRLTLEGVAQARLSTGQHAEARTGYPERHIAAELDLDVAIEADHSRIGQLFSNLLGNAVMHGDPNKPIQVTGFIAQERLEIAVSNSGEPIPEAAWEHLFQPFYRGRVKPHQKGLGLGLYIASEIAQAHGGRIEVESDAEATRFTFRMPV